MTLESLDVRSSYLHISCIFRGIRHVKFVYEDQWSRSMSQEHKVIHGGSISTFDILSHKNSFWSVLSHPLSWRVTADILYAGSAKIVKMIYGVKMVDRSCDSCIAWKVHKLRLRLVAALLGWTVSVGRLVIKEFFSVVVVVFVVDSVRIVCLWLPSLYLSVKL